MHTHTPTMLGGQAKEIKTIKISTKSRQRPKRLKIDSSKIKSKVRVLKNSIYLYDNSVESSDRFQKKTITKYKMASNPCPMQRGITRCQTAVRERTKKQR